ncbi:metalloprotease [Candidatus Micrarchaeota archaeon]|nr:MAG: metalloprotease [Candidatus Micrarchaeota archaeon]
MAVKIKREVIGNLLELCRAAYPNEVGGMLLGKEIIDDFVLTPSEYGPSSIITRMQDMPIYTNIAGSFHSHPTGDNRPSRADLNFFSKTGKYHLIIAYPYTLNKVAAYDVKGRAEELVII